MLSTKNSTGTQTLTSKPSTSVILYRCTPRRSLHSSAPSFPAEDESPYPEVRSAVANTDDPDMPAGTLRAWALGLIWAVLIPGVNQFYFFRWPSITIGPVRAFQRLSCVSQLNSHHAPQLVAQLLSFPVGRLMARLLPQSRIFGLQLNPGPFSIKEHVVVTIMAGVGATSAYAVRVISSPTPTLTQPVSRPTLSQYNGFITTKHSTLAISSLSLCRRSSLDFPSAGLPRGFWSHRRP